MEKLEDSLRFLLTISSDLPDLPVNVPQEQNQVHTITYFVHKFFTL